MPVRSVAVLFARQARLLALVYLLVIPAVIIGLSAVAVHNLSTNREQTRAQRTLIAQNQALLASNHRLAVANCQRSELLLGFIDDIAERSPANSFLRRKYIDLVFGYDKLGDCPPFKGRR